MPPDDLTLFNNINLTLSDTFTVCEPTVESSG